MQQVIIVSSRLPVKIDKTIESFESALASVMESIDSTNEVWWIGWPGVEVGSQKEQTALASRLKQEQKHIPVFMSEDEVEQFFNGYCFSSLLPVLLYVPSQLTYNEAWYECYKNINTRYAEAILERARPGDMIWIHDYHLMLVPSILKELNSDLKIGFFFHTPFPSFEIFRSHPQRAELLRGVLGADLIGFHTFGYLRHFRSTILRLLGIESEFNSISFEGTTTRIGVHPLGINAGMFNSILKSPGCQDLIAQYKEQYQDKRLILSVESLNYAQGLPRTLQAIEMFLESNPDLTDSVVFMIIYPPEKNLSDDENFQKEIEYTVGRINGQYSTVTNIPIQFINRRIDRHELCALYSIAGIALITPLMDGMNLIAKEYVICQDEDPGVLILSEFAGAAQELWGAVMVNPYNTNEISRAITAALKTPEAKRVKMMSSMKKRVMNYDSRYWCNSFFKALEEAVSEKSSISDIQKFTEKVVEPFKKKNKKKDKALFLDYDGTLREFVDDPDLAVPDEDLIETLDILAKRPDVDVYIISGRNPDFLEKHFGSYPFTLIGEHGYYLKEGQGSWETLVGEIDMSWKEKLMEIFNLHTISTPGSSVEEKNSALVWHYRKSDPEFGEWKATELIGELTEAISNLPVEIHHGKKIIEVSSQHVNKGLAAARYIKEKNYKHILLAGDDKTDETMFHFDGAVTVKIGNQETDADYRIPTSKMFRKILKYLAHAV